MLKGIYNGYDMQEYLQRIRCEGNDNQKDREGHLPRVECRREFATVGMRKEIYNGQNRKGI
jgi:hypothetical protein